MSANPDVDEETRYAANDQCDHDTLAARQERNIGWPTRDAL